MREPKRLEVRKEQAQILLVALQEQERASRAVALIVDALTAGLLPAGSPIVGVDAENPAILYDAPPGD